MKKQRLFYLDFIRVMSTVAILIYHFNVWLPRFGIDSKGVFSFIPSLSTIGVSLFIIISGASLMYTTSEKLTIKDFYNKRFLGIFPVFYVSYIFALAIQVFLRGGMSQKPIWTAILTVFGVDGYFSGIIPNFYLVGEWFMGFIILFYLAFPILRKGIKEKPRLTIVIIIAIYIVGLIINKYHMNVIKYPSILVRLPEFAFGMYFVEYIKKPKWYIIVPASLMGVTYIVLKVLDLSLPQTVTTIACLSFFMVFVFIGYIIKWQSIQRFFIWIAKYSFGCILANQVAMWFVLKYILNDKIGIHALSPKKTYLIFGVTCLVIFLWSFVATKLSKIIVVAITNGIKKLKKKTTENNVIEKQIAN